MTQKENNYINKNFYRASAEDFSNIPGCPIAYWASENLRKSFKKSARLDELSPVKVGLQTGSNEQFVREWFEISVTKASLYLNEDGKHDFGKKWFPYNKGGEYRKWYGNNENVVNWKSDGNEIRNFSDKNGKLRSRPQNIEWYFRESITWSFVSSSYFGVRFSDTKAVFDVAGSSAFPEGKNKYFLTGLLCSKLAHVFMSTMNPTMNFQVGNVAAIPVLIDKIREINDENVEKLIEAHKHDWNSYETSWDFICSPLIQKQLRLTLKDIYSKILTNQLKTTLEMQHLEENNNRLFIEAYGMQDELTPEVPISEITLTCNPHYRYGGKATDEEREQRLQSDTISELISYIIGCMMGRYSIDRKGLVYAQSGNEGFKALVEEGAYFSFPADNDGILPLTSEPWFEDDIATRIEDFVCRVWNAEHLEENLQFIADSLCFAAIQPLKRGDETSRETIRRYLSTQFFKDHLRTYKKRPIYWLFSSGKERAFECLVYLHRYNETTLPRMRTEYVTPLLGQMDNRIAHLRLQQNEAETAEAKRIGKKIDSLTKQLTELRAFDDQLKHYADMKIQLDLDDGVKVNYGKFGTLLAEVKAVTGDKTD
ncbi:BREX-1 system adenine-specific DNA-methyltransferase PglX [Pantoea ananatis]|uniref:BREX-1 system adenine-specific DNA-methyltransferase PglX n=1 Tax=Pantoea ananas TaxID=553 RepID=UPI003C26700D